MGQRHHRGRRLFLLMLLAQGLVLNACADDPPGLFAWAATDDRDIQEPELGLLETESYRIGRNRLYFFDYETIRWVYRVVAAGLEPQDRVVVALYEVKNTPTPVEVDLREVPVEVSDGEALIRQKYEPLAAGRYLIKLAHEDQVVDQVYFEVVPPGGPGAVQNGDLFDDLDRKPSEDDIIRYSSQAPRGPVREDT